MNKVGKNKILHDLKRISSAGKLLMEELDKLYEDVEETFGKEGEEKDGDK